jgi:hypothetical protein
LINLYEWSDALVEYFKQYDIYIESINVGITCPINKIGGMPVHNFTQIEIEMVLMHHDVDHIKKVIEDENFLNEYEFQFAGADALYNYDFVTEPGCINATVKLYQKEPQWAWDYE